MERSGQGLAKFERDLNMINPEEKTNILASRLLQLNTDYNTAASSKLDELTSILVDGQSQVKDQAVSHDTSPSKANAPGKGRLRRTWCRALNAAACWRPRARWTKC